MKLLKSQGYSLSEIGEMAGVSGARVSQLICGLPTPREKERLAALYNSAETVESIAAKLGIKKESLFRHWAHMGLSPRERSLRFTPSGPSRYGNWRVIRRVWVNELGQYSPDKAAISPCRRGHIYLECECLLCNRLYPVASNNLRTGASTCCRSCSCRQKNEQARKNKEGDQ
jgi:DNA-binding CsgD family transcriptional regulator